MKLLKKTTGACLALLVSFSLFANFTAYSQVSETDHHLTVKDLVYAASKYLDEESAKNNGYFMFKDNTGEVKLKLKKIHDDRLRSLNNTLHFICADFTAAGLGIADGIAYDIDIFIEGTDKSNLKVSEVKVHKKNGKALYAWYEEDGMWKTRDATVAVPQKK